MIDTLYTGPSQLEQDVRRVVICPPFKSSKIHMTNIFVNHLLFNRKVYTILFYTFYQRKNLLHNTI